MAVDKASTISGVEVDQHCAYDKRACDICEVLVIHPNLDPVPAPRTIGEARAARRQAQEEERQREMSGLYGQMSTANHRSHEEDASLREALHFQHVNEAVKRRIRRQQAEGQYQSWSRRAARHEYEFSGIRRGLKTEQLYLAMRARMKEPGLSATWP